MVENVRALISLHEGRVAHAYQDSLGYWTIGVGHLIDKQKGGSIPDEIIDDLLDHDIAKVAQELRARLPWAKDLDNVRYAVLVDMAFNLGIEGLLKFKNTLTYVQDKKYLHASAGMLSSLWAKQVGPRAIRLAKMMSTGEWPK